VITGGPGHDTLTGDAGFDRFVFLADPGTTDRISDFTDNGDQIDLTRFHLTEIASHITDTAAGALIDLGGGQTLLVSGITAAALVNDILL
jgi:Ca2+-binding RTX toxin-like protein